MSTLTFDIAHLLAGSLVLVSFLLLYQDRLYALLNVYALHALVLATVGGMAGLRARRAAALHHRGASRCCSRPSSSRWRCIA